MLRLTWLAVLVALVAVPQPATAADHSLLGTKLMLKRSGTHEKLTFTTRDAALLFPALGSADDPGTGSPGVHDCTSWSSTAKQAHQARVSGHAA